MSVNLKKPDFSAAVFDLDGTLFDSMGFWNSLDEVFLRKHGVDRVPEDYLLDIAHLGAYDTALYTKKRFGFPESPEEIMEEWHTDALKFYSTSVQLKPGARGYIEMLRGAGIILGVATANSADLYLPALDRLGIRSLFSGFAEVNECQRRKGFPDIYELACSRMGAEPADTVVFEDIYIAVKGAKDGGFRTVGVYDAASSRDTQRIREEADGFIFSFADLLS
ncbi:MAG: HAD family phosphatase [Ruminiclostridium sp.]|nr:HAD family phosphatase [Ruminiclostridium sp.]